jgi:hypothetical protein
MKKPPSKRGLQVMDLTAFQDDEERRASSPLHAQQPRRNRSVGCRRFVVTKQ